MFHPCLLDLWLGRRDQLFILLLLAMSETASFVDPVFLARFGLYVA
jgi:hypothetical protein